MITYRDICKVLPLVYDDTLSYYEVLCKVRDKMNEIVDLDNAQSEAINDLSSDMGERYNEFEKKILKDLADLKDELETEIASGDENVIETLGTLISNLSEDVGGLEETVNSLSETVSGYGQTISDLSSTVSGLDDTVGTLTSNVTSLGERMTQAESDIDNLESSVAGLAQDVAGNTETISGINERVGDIEEELEHFVFSDVDDQLSTSSANPVENSVITTALNALDSKVDNLEFADLPDVDMTNVSNGQVPAWNSTTQKYEPLSVSGGVTTLSGLSDVSISSPVKDDVLVYDGAGDYVNSKKLFNLYAGLTNKTDSITYDNDGNVSQIVQSDTGNGIVCTSTFTYNSGGDVTSIVTTVVPNFGDYDYTETVTFTYSSGELTSISESYTSTAKV